MSVEQRLRHGLAANTAHLGPNLDHEFAVILRRVHRRRVVRRAGYGAAAVAVAAAAVFGFPSAIDAMRGLDGSPDPAVAPTEPTPVVTTTLDLGGDTEALGAGTYAMTFLGSGAEDKPQVVIEVPSYAFTFNGAFLITGGDLTFRAIGLWTVAEVTANPCYAGDEYQDPGPTVEDLATALVAQPNRDSTEPVPVSIGAYDGLYMELSVPTDLDFDDCVNGSYDSWRTDDDFVRSHQGPGQVDRLWILDVEGNRLVVGTSHNPATSSDHVAELTQMIESITFTNTGT